MKTVLSSSANPTFTPSSGTLNFSTAVASYGFQFGRLLGIINLTQNAILYTAGMNGYGGTWNSGTRVLTLDQSTTSMGSGDTLEVIWDDPKASVILDAPNPSVPMGWPSVFSFVTANTTNATSVKSSPGTLGGFYISAGAASAYNSIYLKIYDKASAPTVGTDTPKFIFGGGSAGGYSSNFQGTVIPVSGVKFTNGIALAATGLPAVNDTTAVYSGFQVGLIYA